MVHLRKKKSLKKCLKGTSDTLTYFHVCTCPIFIVSNYPYQRQDTGHIILLAELSLDLGIL